MISVVVPVYDEEGLIETRALYFRRLSRVAELIFVDGGSTDRTPTLAAGLGRLLEAPKGRARQMNLGAARASGDLIVFLHVDGIVHPEHLQELEGIVARRRIDGGCFTQVLDDPAWVYRWIAWTGNLRARWTRIFYGDEAIFVRRPVFERLGGFPLAPLGEDVLFSRRLRSGGRTVVLPYPVCCSVRRWKERGILRTFLLNCRIRRALVRGAPDEALAAVYGDVRGPI